MKQFFIISFFILAIAEIRAGEWEKVDSIKYNYSVWFLGVESINKESITVLSRLNSRMPLVTQSQDSGKTWKTILADTISGETKTAKALDLVYKENSFIFISCDSGYYWRSPDNGKNWKKLRTPDSSRIYQVDFWDKDNGVAGFADDLYGRQFITSDGGLSWTPLEIHIDAVVNEGTFFYLKTAGDSLIFYIHAEMNDVEKLSIYRSSNRGKSWTKSKIHHQFQFHFLNEKLGFAYGGRQYAHESPQEYKEILKTTDGGVTWRQVLDTFAVPYDRIVDLSFCDEKHGVAAAVGSVWKTDDGGETWYQDPDYRLFETIDDYLSFAEYIRPGYIIAFASNPYRYIWRWSDGTVSVHEDNAKNKLTVYPNPVTNNLKIDPENLLPNAKFEIYGTNGRLCLSGKVDDGIILTSSLIPGTYFISIISGDNVFQGSFVKM